MNFLKNAFNTQAILSAGAAAVYPVTYFAREPGNAGYFVPLLGAAPLFCAAFAVSGLFAGFNKQDPKTSRIFAFTAAAAGVVGVSTGVGFDFVGLFLSSLMVPVAGGLNFVAATKRNSTAAPAPAVSGT